MSMERISRRAAGLAALFLLFGLSIRLGEPAAAETQGGAREALTIVTKGGERLFEVEIADSPAEQAVGLMYRTSLPQGTGMLFVHSGPRELTMWMRNTYISLDMIFIRADGTVHRIVSRTEPLSEEIVSSGGAVTGVLEIAGGSAAAFGIAAGDKVLHRHFGAR